MHELETQRRKTTKITSWVFPGIIVHLKLSNSLQTAYLNKRQERDGRSNETAQKVAHKFACEKFTYGTIPAST